VHGETGFFFEEPTVDSLCEAISWNEKTALDPSVVRKRAEQFSRARCEQAFRAVFAEYIR
jgi:hypothetical protein